MGYFAIPPFFNFCTMAEEKEKNMFEISGGEVDRDQLLDIVAKNADGYAQWRLQRQPGKNAILKKNRQDAFNVDGFHKALNDITTAISEGKLKRGAGNVYIHSDGVVWEDPEHRAALDLVNRGIDTIGKAQPKEKKKYSKTGLFDRFNNKFYGGNFTGSEQDWEIWKNNPESVNNVIKLLNEEYDSISNDDEMDYTDSPYKDRAEHLQRISKLRQNLANGVDESDYSDWVALGGDGEFFRNVTGLKKAEKSELETKWEAVATAMREAGYDEETIANRKEQFYKQEQNRLNAPFYDYDYNENWNKFASTNWSKRGSTQLTSLGSDDIDDSDWKGKYENEALNKPGWIEREGNASYADQLYKRAISGSFVDGSRDGYSNKQILRLYMNDQLEQDPQQFTTINQDSYFINSTFDLDSGTGIAYNKKTNTFTRVHVDPNNTPILLGKLKEMYLKKNPYNPSHTLGEWGSFKKTGGKLSKLKELRNGGNITYALSGAELAQRNKERRTSEYKQSVAERAQQQGVSEDVILARDVAAKDDNSFNSVLRWVGTGFDVLGAGLSFVPVIGNALGAASGTIGTGLNLAADAMDDSVTSEEMWTNLGLNAAMTGLMLIPGGGTASIAGKALKTAKALVPAGASAYAGYQVASNWDRIKELEGKRKKGELSHAELRELQMYASMAAGSVTGAKHTAAQAAPTVSKVSKTAGKITAGIADPIPGVQALFGNKKAKGVINSMTKDLKAPTIKVTDSKDGPEITFTDSNGKTFKLNADQEKAMTAVFNKGRKEGWSGEKLNEELGKAWANNHDDKTVWYRRDSKDAVTENIQKKWDLNADNEGAKGVLTSTKDPDGNTEIAGITFSKDSVKTLKEAYKQAADDFKSKNSSLPEEELNLQAHSKGIEAAKKKFADLSESVEQKVVQDAVEGTLNPDAPVFGMQDLSKWDKFKNRFGIKDTLNIDKETSSSSWFGPGNAYKFDPNYAVGRGNIAARVKQRNQAQGYLGDNQVANWALDHFNTNWEMAQGMSGIRTRTDRVLDAQSARRTAMASPKGQSKLRKQNIDKELESRGITNPRWRDRLPLVEAMKERMYEAYLKNKNRRASRKPKASLGMKLQRLQEIRMGFIQDNSHSSNELSKFARGGIIKAQWGSDSSKWFEDSFDQKYLTGWNESLDASKAGESLNTNPSHSKYGTLQGAYEANQAYTGNSNLVGQDLNTYYNNRYKDYNLQAYIDAYNKDAKTISDRWTRNHSYGDTGATAHNQLFKAMFANRSGNTNEAYDLGYSDSSQDIQGSTTWMRRMDRYNKKWNDSSLTDDERKKRIHEITLGDGSKGYVYKENDGTIGVVDNDTLNKLGYTTKTEDTKQPEESSTGATRSTSSIGSTPSAGSTGDAGPEATTDNKFSKIGKQWQDGVPQLLAASRLALNLRNNKKLANLAKKKGVALLSPIQMHKNVYGDFAALMSGNQQGSEIRSAANRIAEKTADADRASLMQLEGEIKSHAPEQEGRLRDNAAITKSREEQWELAQKVYDYNHKAADENMGRLVAKNNADIDMDMGLAAANTTNWNNFLSGLENDTRIKNADQKAKNYQLYQQYIQDWATSQIEDEHYQQLKDKYAATSDSKVYDELKKYKLQKTREIEPKLRQMRYNLLQGNYDMSVFDTPVGDYNMNGGYQMKLKKGGTVKVDSSRMKYRADDLRELRKQIRHNIETNRKALDNLSKATLLELKKMMGI